MSFKTCLIVINYNYYLSNIDSPRDILKSHLTQLLDVINDPEKLANDLSAADLITGPVKNKVLELPNTNYSKASLLVNEFLTSLKVFKEPETLVKFCDILKSQDNANLVRIANSILRELGKYCLICSSMSMCSQYFQALMYQKINLLQLKKYLKVIMVRS